MNRLLSPRLPTWLVLGLVVVLPLLTYPLSWLPPRTGPARMLTIPWAVVATAGVLVWWSLGARGWRTPLFWPLLAMVGSLLLSTRFSAQTGASLAALPAGLANLGLFWLGLQFPADRRWQFCTAWVLTAVVVATYGLARRWFDPVVLSTFGNPNLVAAFLASAVPMVLALWVGCGGPTRPNESSHAGGVLAPPGLRRAEVGTVSATLRGSATATQAGLRRVLTVALAATAVLLLAVVALCRSRGTWLALGLVGAAWAVGRCRAWWRRLVITLALVFVLVLVIGRFFPAVWRTDVRPVIWRSTLRMVADRPLLGHGLGTFELAYPQYRLPEYFARPKPAPVTDHAHNFLLELTAEQGVVGLAAVLWLLGPIAWKATRVTVLGQETFAQQSDPNRKSTIATRKFLLAAAAILFVHGLLDVGLQAAPLGPLFWLLLGVIAGETATTGVNHEIHETHESPEGSLSSPINDPRRSPVRFSCLSCLSWLVPAVLSLTFAGWLVWAGVVQPIRGQWAERKSQIARGRGHLREAIAAAELAVERQPFRPHLRYALAALLADVPTRETRAAAIRVLEDLQGLAPHYAGTDYNLGVLYDRQGDRAQARRYLEYAVRVNPYDADARSALTRVSP